MCANSEKFVFWVLVGVTNPGSPSDPKDPWSEGKLSYINYNIRQDEIKLHKSKLHSVFHHLSSVGRKQLCVLAHLGCTREAGTS